MEREAYIFGKEEIIRRLQLPMERINVLVEELDMPVDSEQKFVEWGVKNFERLWQEMDLYGPIAREEANHPAVAVPAFDGS